MSSFAPIRRLWRNVTITAEASVALVIAEPNYPGWKMAGLPGSLT